MPAHHLGRQSQQLTPTTMRQDRSSPQAKAKAHVHRASQPRTLPRSLHAKISSTARFAVLALIIGASLIAGCAIDPVKDANRLLDS
ncbi:MAG: hypothetical protein K9L32_12545, partial [Chromatiaceae bacterium]|nr:hypothetical protein [Chromatiaceae bacterium]